VKIRPIGNEMFDTARRTDKHNTRFSEVFCENV